MSPRSGILRTSMSAPLCLCNAFQHRRLESLAPFELDPPTTPWGGLADPVPRPGLMQ